MAGLGLGVEIKASVSCRFHRPCFAERTAFGC
jgi:hypothetical protein